MLTDLLIKNSVIKMQKLIYLLPLFLFTSYSLTLTVDSSLSSAIQDVSTPTLQLALNMLLNPPTGQLRDQDNSIILLSNTAGTTQVIDDFTLISNNFGRIKISFENFQKGIPLLTSCKTDLPYIYIHFNAIWNVAGLEYFSFEGVYLEAAAGKLTAQFTNIAALELQNLCLQDNENFEWERTPFYLYNVNDFKIVNATVMHGVGVGFWIFDSLSVIFENIKVYLVTDPTNNPLFRALSTFQVPTARMASIQNVEITWLKEEFIHGIKFFEIESFETVVVSNFSMKNCFLGTAWGEPLRIVSARNITAQNITISNIDLDFPDSESQINFAFITFGDSNVTLSNLAVDDIYVSYHSLRSFKIHIFRNLYRDGGPIQSFVASNITLQNSQFLGYSVLAQFDGNYDDNFDGVLIDNFTVKNCSFYNTALIRLIPKMVGGATQQLPLTSTTSYFINNMLVSDCFFDDSTLIQHNNAYVTTYPIELFIVQVTNMTLRNNNFTGTGSINIIEMISTCLRIANLTASNNNISVSSFIVSSIHVSSFMLINSSISELRLDQGATFLNYNIKQSIGLISWDYYVNSTAVLLETRPFFIVNTTFRDIYTKNQSTLIISNNPTSMIMNCSFDGFQLDDSSSFAVFGKYIPLVKGSIYARSTVAEQGIFQGFKELLDLYASYPSILAEYTGDSLPTYFYIIFENNTFRDVNSQNSLSLISVKDIIAENSIFSIFNGTFSNVTISTDQEFGLIKLSELSQAVLHDVSFLNVAGDGTLFFMHSTQIKKLTLSSCSISETQNITGYQIKASECRDIAFADNSANLVESQSDWMQIDCDLIDSTASAIVADDEEGVEYPSPITIQNSSFLNIIITSSTDLLLSPAFFRLGAAAQSFNLNSNDDSSSYSNLVLKKVTFKNISLDKTAQKYAREMFTSPIIQITASQLGIVFDTVTLNGLSITPIDNVLSISAVAVSFFMSSFTNFIHNEMTGAIYLVTKSLNISGSLFQGNQGLENSQSGLITLVNPDDITPLSVAVDGTSFIGNNAPMATLMNLKGFSINLNITNSVISDNLARESGLILLQSAKISELYFKNVTFSYSAEVDSTGNDFGILTIKDCQEKIEIIINDSSLDMSGYVKGSLLIFEKNSEATVQISNFTYNTNLPLNGSTSFGMMKADKVDAIFDNITLSGGLHINNNSLFEIDCTRIGETLFDSSSLQLRNSAFDTITLGQGCSLFELKATNLVQQDICQAFISIEDSVFSNIEMLHSVSSIDVEDAIGAFIKVDSSQFVGKDSDRILVNLVNNTFQNISAIQGSIYLGQRLQNGASLYLKNNSFHNISAAQNGGIICLSETSIEESESTTDISESLRNLDEQNILSENISIIDCNFESIFAQNGGIVYSGYSTHGDTTITLQNSSLTNISVSERGGVVYGNDNTLILTNNTFQSISASVAGPLIYSDTSDLTPATLIAGGNTFTTNPDSTTDDVVDYIAFAPNTLEIELLSPNSIHIEQIQADDGSYMILRNLSSFSLEELELKFTLYFKNQTQQVSQRVVDRSPNPWVLFSFYSPGSDAALKKINSTCSDSQCLLQSPPVTLFGQANSKVKVTVNYSSSSDLQYQVFTQFYIEIRECRVGEINNTLSGGTCELCEKGTYSLNSSDKVCSTCPNGAECAGGSDVVAKANYWKSSDPSRLIIPCLGHNRCTGGALSPCAEPFEGPVCLQCNSNKNYIANGQGHCTLCYSQENLSLLAGVILIISILFQLYVMITTYKDNFRLYAELQTSSAAANSTYLASQVEIGKDISHQKDCSSPHSREKNPKPGVFLAIFVTFAQMCSIFMKLIQEGVFVTYFFGIINSIGNPNDQALFSLQCLLVIQRKTPFELLRFQTLLFVFSPIIKLLILLIIELLKAAFNRRDKNLRFKLVTRIGVAAISLIILEQPGIVGALCDYLSCVRLDLSSEILYVATNPNVQCGTDQYNLFRAFFVIPALVVWVLLIPISIFLVLRSYKPKLMKSQRLYVIFGVLYSNYLPRAYYWGILTVFFKIIVYVLNSVLSTSLFGRGAAIILVVHVYHVLYQRASPHWSTQVKKTEGYIIRSFMWTILLILLLNLSEGIRPLQIILEVGIVGINISAMGYLLLKLVLKYQSIIRKFVKRKCKPRKGEDAIKEQNKLEESVQGIEISRANIPESGNEK